ncbi:MAG: methyltransferase domain-containing protein [Pseudomonadota bacterium]
MRASTASGARAANENGAPRSIWGAPRGAAGLAALALMACENQGQNRAALDALDLKRGDVVLDVGCGPGAGMCAALKRVGREGFVAGVDRSGCAVHVAAHVAHYAILRGRAAVMRAEAASLPFRDLMFDKAFAVNSFQFWPEPSRALREIARVLAPGGRLVIAQRASREDRPTDFAGAARGMERITQATALLKAQGWRIIDERCVADGPHALAACVAAIRPA